MQAMKEVDGALCLQRKGAGGRCYLGGERCGGKLVVGSEKRCRRRPPSLSMSGTPPDIKIATVQRSLLDSFLLIAPKTSLA